MEIWKEINGHANYSVSNKGRIRNDKTNKILTLGDNGKGYLYVRLMANGRCHKYYVHRLVAQSFIPNPDNLSDVNHIDEDKSNNSVENLEWLSHKDNMMHGTGRLRRLQNLTSPNKPKQVLVDGIQFTSTTTASEFIGCPRSTLRNALHRGQTEFNGHKISFASATSHGTAS